MSSFTLHVASEFSRLPGGRLKKHGPRSGEQFREQFVIPLMRKHDSLIFDLSGSAGYSTGWLDEAFGFLGKQYSVEELQERLTFKADDDPETPLIIWKRIQEAADE